MRGERGEAGARRLMLVALPLDELAVPPLLLLLLSRTGPLFSTCSTHVKVITYQKDLKKTLRHEQNQN